MICLTVLKTTLEYADIDLTQNYVIKDIKYKLSIDFVEKYKNIKKITKVYFDKIQYKIKSIKINSDESINVNVTLIFQILLN